MSQIAKLIDDIINSGLKPRMKSGGYRKSGRTFYRDAGTFTAVANVQASRSNSGAQGRFSINLGIYFPDVAEITNALPFTGSFPKEYDCTVRQRLGVLMTEGDDYWWEVKTTSNVVRIADNINVAWRKYGEPWIDTMSNLDAAHVELVKQNLHFVAAGISLILNRRDEAAELINLAKKRQPMAAGRIRDWAKKHHLTET